MMNLQMTKKAPAAKREIGRVERAVGPRFEALAKQDPPFDSEGRSITMFTLIKRELESVSVLIILPLLIMAGVIVWVVFDGGVVIVTAIVDGGINYDCGLC